MEAKKSSEIIKNAEIIYPELSRKIVGAAFNVLNALGCGFLEKVYENALVVELMSMGLKCTQQVPFKIIYKSVEVGLYVADLVVEDRVLLELKAVDAVTPVHKAKTMNYLHCSKLRLAIIMNFARPRLEYERIVL